MLTKLEDEAKEGGGGIMPHPQANSEALKKVNISVL